MTGVQTCALPISATRCERSHDLRQDPCTQNSAGGSGGHAYKYVKRHRDGGAESCAHEMGHLTDGQFGYTADAIVRGLAQTGQRAEDQQ